MKENKDIDTNLEPAINYFGSGNALARAMGLNPMAVTQWKRRGIPAERAKQISELTDGEIKPSVIKPKLFSIQ